MPDPKDTTKTDPAPANQVVFHDQTMQDDRTIKPLVPQFNAVHVDPGLTIQGNRPNGGQGVDRSVDNSTDSDKK
jgi:hypothetical protein